MKNKAYRCVCLGFLMLVVFLTACGASSEKSGASAAVEAYVQALTAGDANALANVSCSTWESNAKTELESFAAVTVSLQDMQCKKDSQDGDTTLVACTGKIVANYGTEVLEINLSDRIYQVVSEGGEWRVCGYR
jgi:hypothetical protein